MNKYLIVVFYIVAGCTVAVPVENSNLSEVSPELWAEMEEMVSEGEFAGILSKENKAYGKPVKALLFRAEDGKVIVSSLHLPDAEKCNLQESRILKDADYEQVTVFNDVNSSSIEIRAPGC